MHKWQTHINNICRTVSRNIFLLSKLSQIVSHQAKLGFFFAHIMSHINFVSNAWDGCACVHMKQLYSLHKRAIKFLMPSPNMDYNQKCCALKLLPLDIHNYYSTNVFYAKYFSRQSPTVPDNMYI